MTLENFNFHLENVCHPNIKKPTNIPQDCGEY